MRVYRAYIRWKNTDLKRKVEFNLLSFNFLNGWQILLQQCHSILANVKRQADFINFACYICISINFYCTFFVFSSASGIEKQSIAASLFD